MLAYNWKSATANWYLRWRLAVQKAKDAQSPADRDVYQFAAVIAQAGHVINRALELQKERENR